MLPASRKAKGRKYQQKVARFLLESFPELTEDDIVSRSMGNSGTDLLLSPAAQRLIPFSFECKNTKEKPGLKALEQSQNNLYPGTTAIVLWKPPRVDASKSIAMMQIKDIVEIAKKLSP